MCLVLEDFLLAHATRVLRQFRAVADNEEHYARAQDFRWAVRATTIVPLRWVGGFSVRPTSHSHIPDHDKAYFMFSFSSLTVRGTSTAQNFLPRGYQGVGCGKNLAWTGRPRGIRPHWSGRGLPVLTSFRTGCDSWPMLESAKQSRLLLLLPLVEPPCMYSHQYTRFEDQPPHLQCHGAQSLSKLRSITLQSIALLIGCLKVAPPNGAPCLPLTSSEVH